MQDRISENPGRVLITPERGPAYYANVTRADNPTQEGTPLNKGSLLTDITAARFGLGASAVPDDVLRFIGKFNQHWWRRRTNSSHYETGLLERIESAQVTRSNNNRTTFAVPYSDALVVDPVTGEFDLLDPKSVTVGYNAYSNANVLKGKYFKPIDYGREQAIRFAPPDAADAYVGTEGVVYYTTLASCEVHALWVDGAGEWELVYASDENAYPSGGTDADGLEYQYLGVPFQNAVTAPKIATGSYVGTDAYGASTPNSLTFDFTPKAWGIYGGRHTIGGQVYGLGLCLLPWGKGGSNVGYHMVNSTSTTSVTMSYDGNTVSWYSTQGREQQNNHSAFEYYYIAIG